MRQRINERLYTTQLCIKHLGTANPGPADIRNWKESWNTKFQIAISSVHKAQKVLKEQEIPPLLYDIRSNNWDWAGDDVGEKLADWWGTGYSPDAPNRYIVFYEEEDYILFKLLYKNT